MFRLQAIHSDQAAAKARTLLHGVRKKLGVLASGRLTAKLRDEIALAHAAPTNEARQ